MRTNPYASFGEVLVASSRRRVALPSSGSRLASLGENAGEVLGLQRIAGEDRLRLG